MCLSSWEHSQSSETCQAEFLIWTCIKLDLSEIAFACCTCIYEPNLLAEAGFCQDLVMAQRRPERLCDCRNFMIKEGRGTCCVKSCFRGWVTNIPLEWCRQCLGVRGCVCACVCTHMCVFRCERMDSCMCGFACFSTSQEPSQWGDSRPKAARILCWLRKHTAIICSQM